MLHENEPGAWDFARALEARGVPLDAIPLRARRRPARVLRSSSATSPGTGPRSCTRTSSTPTPTARWPGCWRACRCASRRSTASTSSARAGRSRSPTARSPASRTCTSPSRAASRATSRRPRASREESFEIVHYGITPNGEPAAVRGRRAAPALRRPADPDQGPHRPAARVRRRAAGGARASSSTSPAAARSSRRCARSRASSGSPTRCASSATSRRSRARSSGPAIVVVPSMGEGFGMVALEAMERARPVIAAEIGGLGELVRDGETGLLVAPGEAEPLRAAIVRARREPASWPREMGAAGRRPRAARLPRGALRRPDGAPLPRGARTEA